MGPVLSSVHVDDEFCEENGIMLAVCSYENLGFENVVF